MRILMVCLGNICRSPLAEGLLRSKLEQEGLKNIFVDSAGTGGWHAGEQPDRRSIAVAARYGLDISHQCARQLQPDDLKRFDYIFAMDKTNLRDILALARSEEEKAKVHLFLPFAGKNEPEEVPDPWYGTDQSFEEVYSLLEQACSQAAKRIIRDSGTRH